MEQYIEREKFLKKSAECFGHFGVLIKAIEEIANECTTADVVLKSEVAREIFEEIERMCIDLLGNFNHTSFIELKKKYTEGKQ